MAVAERRTSYSQSLERGLAILSAFAPGRPLLGISELGSRLPAYRTSMGKVLLAFLPDDARAAVLDATELVGRSPNTVTSRRGLEADLERVRETESRSTTRRWCTTCA